MWTTVSKPESEGVFASHCDRRQKMGPLDNSKHRKSRGMLGHASTSRARPNIHGAKVMFCIWCYQFDVVYYELFKPSVTITEDRYRTQLMRLSRALKEKRPQYQERHDKVILQYDNVWAHVARPVKTYLEANTFKIDNTNKKSLLNSLNINNN